MKYFLTILFISSLIFSQTQDQIKQAKDFIERSGMNQNQAIKLAKERGYSDAEINSFKKKAELSQNSSNKNISEKNSTNSTNEPGNTIKNTKDVLPADDFTNNPSDDLSNDEITSDGKDQKIQNTQLVSSNYFGYKIFSGDPSLFQSTSFGAVDPDYLIGPGDEIIVMMWGETQFREQLTVDREGFIFVPEIGQVFVNGLNLNLLESKLFKVFSQSYASLNPQGKSPTTFLDVSLGILRPLRIQVLGEVAQPGAYTVSPSSTLFSSLYYFNGPLFSGSLRDIQLIRGGEKIISIDFYDYLLTGKKPKDQKLQLDDVVFVPRRLKTVSLIGEVNRTGIFELKQGEDLLDLISIAGGLKVTAYLDRCLIDRIVPFNDREEFEMDRMFIDVSLNNLFKSKDKFELQEGDRINIFSILDERSNIVEIRGAVARPGSYDLSDSLRISQLIEKADGVLGDVYLDRIDVVRTKPDFSKELIKLDLKKILDKNLEEDIFLKGYDEITVYGLTEMSSKPYVLISGHTKIPGVYALQENMRIYDLIFKAGGFLDEDFRKRAYLDRLDLIRYDDNKITKSIFSFNLGNILESTESDDNVLLEAGDEIRVYSNDIFVSSKFITINGQVKNPGTYSLKMGMEIKDLVLEAGGFKNNMNQHIIEVGRINKQNVDFNNYATIDVFSIDSNFSISEINVANGKGQSDEGYIKYELKPYDFISVRPDPFFTLQKKVLVRGEVLYPGEYTIINSNEKILDIVNRSGGILPNAYPEASKYFRNGVSLNVPLDKIFKNPKSSHNFKVQDGDEITIVPYSNIVIITGEVSVPGAHIHYKNKRLDYYIRIAGGLTPEADEKNIWIQYPSGISKKYKRFSFKSPKVPDGSVINVGKKKEEKEFDPTEFAKELTSILANIAQAIGILILARN